MPTFHLRANSGLYGIDTFSESVLGSSELLEGFREMCKLLIELLLNACPEVSLGGRGAGEHRGWVVIYS